nr:alpha and gamma adaptin binding protein [Hymenolepis microstoma]
MSIEVSGLVNNLDERIRFSHQEDTSFQMCSFALIIDAFATDVVEAVHKGLTKTSKNQDSTYIDCKYYTASVQLKKISASESMSSIFDAECIIICFDPNKSGSLKLAYEWLEVDKDGNIPVRLLVCETLPDSPLTTEIFKSAISNYFEVVQLSPPLDEIEEDEEFGVKRILSAMTAHEWSSSVLKDSREEPEKTISREEPDAVGSNGDEGEVDGSDNEEFDDEAFSELFPKLIEARSKAASLDFDKRRKMAERMTVRLWRAMKLDEGEIDGLSDGDD